MNFTYHEASDISRELHREERWLALCRVVDHLEAFQVKSVTLRYSGSGDSGDFSEMEANPEAKWRKAIAAPEVEVTEFSVEPMPNTKRQVQDAVWKVQGRKTTISISELVEISLHECVGMFFGGYENNEGGGGTATLDVANRKVTIDHTDNIMEEVIVDTLELDEENEHDAKLIQSIIDCCAAAGWSGFVSASGGTMHWLKPDAYSWNIRYLNKEGQQRGAWGERDADQLCLALDAWQKARGQHIVPIDEDEGESLLITLAGRVLTVHHMGCEEKQEERESRVYSIKYNRALTEEEENE